jgi:hypothetical protein
MKWPKRGFWIAAWAVWLWLGVGLYRELPRDLGPVVCRLPVSARMVSPLGFVGDSDTFAMQWPREGALPPTLRLFDAQSGREVGNLPLPLLPGTLTQTNRSTFFDNLRMGLRRGFLFGVQLGDPPPAGRPLERNFQVLDLASGEWRRLTTRPVCHVALHPRRPWAALIEGESQEKPERAFVIDLRSGREIMSRTFAPGDSIPHPPFFIAGRDALALSLRCKPADGGRGDRTEVWGLSGEARLDDALVGLASCDGLPTPISVSMSGRMFFDFTHVPQVGRPRWADVYDFETRQFLTTVPVEERQRVEAGELLRWYRGPVYQVIAPTGRAALRCALGVRGESRSPMGLYEVGTGRLLWQTAPHESVVEAPPEGGFVVKELWHDLWKRWLPNLEFKTLACRDLESGNLVARTAAATIVDPLNCNARRTLAVLPDGAVHRIPLRVNWPLLVLCQTILALPLILAWSFLRWRKRRKRQAVAPA